MNPRPDMIASIPSVRPANHFVPQLFCLLCGLLFSQAWNKTERFRSKMERPCVPQKLCRELCWNLCWQLSKSPRLPFPPISNLKFHAVSQSHGCLTPMTSTITNDSNRPDGLTAPAPDVCRPVGGPDRSVDGSGVPSRGVHFCTLFSDPLLKIRFHKASQSRHKPIRTLTKLYKAKQTSKKNRNTKLVNKPSYVARTFLSAVPQTFQSASRISCHFRTHSDTS
jgi:hypothetical protein